METWCAKNNYSNGRNIRGQNWPKAFWVVYIVLNMCGNLNSRVWYCLRLYRGLKASSCRLTQKAYGLGHIETQLIANIVTHALRDSANSIFSGLDWMKWTGICIFVSSGGVTSLWCSPYSSHCCQAKTQTQLQIHWSMSMDEPRLHGLATRL